MNDLPAVSDGWSEGRYLDLWMLVHFLSGSVGAFANVFFDFSQPTVYAIGVALMIAWEVIEYLMGVREHWTNRVLDVGVGLLGVWLALFLASRVDTRTEYWLLGGTLAVALGLMATGVRAFKARRVAPSGHKR